jgi:hypothetical protein
VSKSLPFFLPAAIASDATGGDQVESFASSKAPTLIRAGSMSKSRIILTQYIHQPTTKTYFRFQFVFG